LDSLRKNYFGELTTKGAVRQSLDQIRKKVFTTKDTKSTKFGVLIIRTLRVLCIAVVECFRGSRKFSSYKISDSAALGSGYELIGARSAPYENLRDLLILRGEISVPPLRPLRPFDFAQDMLCARYSEFRLALILLF